MSDDSDNVSVDELIDELGGDRAERALSSLIQCGQVVGSCLHMANGASMATTLDIEFTNGKRCSVEVVVTIKDKHDA